MDCGWTLLFRIHTVCNTYSDTCIGHYTFILHVLLEFTVLVCVGVPVSMYVQQRSRTNNLCQINSALNNECGYVYQIQGIDMWIYSDWNPLRQVVPMSIDIEMNCHNLYIGLCFLTDLSPSRPQGSNTICNIDNCHCSQRLHLDEV